LRAVFWGPDGIEGVLEIPDAWPTYSEMLLLEPLSLMLADDAPPDDRHIRARKVEWRRFHLGRIAGGDLEAHYS